jgi:hypothetical protein
MDFQVFFTAGRLANSGHAIVAYDQLAFHRAMEATIGYSFPDNLPWQYPPQFFAITSILAVLPYPVAYFGFAAATWLLMLWAFWKISGDIRVALAAALTPMALYNFGAAQTAALVSALLGLALYYLPKRPIASAAIITLLTFKPQFGLAIPPTLISWRAWRAFAGATIGAIAILLAIYLWNAAIVPAFLLEIRTGYAIYVSQYGGAAGIPLHSLYAVARRLGLDETPALVVQALSALFAIMAIARSRQLPLNLRNAVVVLATLAITPYVMTYDFLLVTLALVFLYRDAPFDTAEEVLVGTIMLFAWLIEMRPTIPAGPVVVALASYVAWRRAAKSYEPSVETASVA